MFTFPGLSIGAKRTGVFFKSVDKKVEGVIAAPEVKNIMTEDDLENTEENYKFVFLSRNLRKNNVIRRFVGELLKVGG